MSDVALLVKNLRSLRTQNTSTRETISSITEYNGSVMFTFNSRAEDLIWCIRAALMLLKQSGKSKATQGQITFGPRPYSVLYTPTR